MMKKTSTWFLVLFVLDLLKKGISNAGSMPVGIQKQVVVESKRRRTSIDYGVDVVSRIPWCVNWFRFSIPRVSKKKNIFSFVSFCPGLKIFCSHTPRIMRMLHPTTHSAIDKVSMRTLFHVASNIMERGEHDAWITKNNELPWTWGNQRACIIM
jgi:hypothetical protein